MPVRLAISVTLLLESLEQSSLGEAFAANSKTGQVVPGRRFIDPVGGQFSFLSGLVCLPAQCAPGTAQPCAPPTGRTGVVFGERRRDRPARVRVDRRSRISGSLHPVSCCPAIAVDRAERVSSG